jgi:hypothetical protein
VPKLKGKAKADFLARMARGRFAGQLERVRGDLEYRVVERHRLLPLLAGGGWNLINGY